MKIRIEAQESSKFCGLWEIKIYDGYSDIMTWVGETLETGIEVVMDSVNEIRVSQKKEVEDAEV